MKIELERKVNGARRIRDLNDRLRIHHIGGRIMLTCGVKALEPETVRKIVCALAHFNECNDPYDEHDCAILEVDNISILWKIDYYDEMLTQRSADPADHNITVRTLTVMLVEEY